MPRFRPQCLTEAAQSVDRAGRPRRGHRHAHRFLNRASAPARPRCLTGSTWRRRHFSNTGSAPRPRSSRGPQRRLAGQLYLCALRLRSVRSHAHAREVCARRAIDDLIFGVRVDGRVDAVAGWARPSIEQGDALSAGRRRGRSKISFSAAVDRRYSSASPARHCTRAIGQGHDQRSGIDEPAGRGSCGGVSHDAGDRADTLDDRVKARLAEQALDLIALALTVGDATPTLSFAAVNALMRLKSMIDARISDPALRPADVAAAAGISVRYANALLAEEKYLVRALHPAPPSGAVPPRTRRSAAGASDDRRDRI